MKDIIILTQENQLLNQSVDALKKDKEEITAEKNKVGYTFVQCLVFSRFTTILILNLGSAII